MTALIVKIIIGTAILTALQIAAALVLPPPITAPPNNVLPWLVTSNVAVAGMLVYLASRSAWSGVRLAAALFAVSYGIMTFSSLVEAYFFRIVEGPEVRQLFLQSIPVPLIFAPIAAMLAGRWRAAPAAPRPRADWSAAEWIGRVAACAFAYLVLYFAAGMIIFPYVEPFYSQRPLPAPLAVISLQLLLRGPVFALIAALVVRMVPGTRRAHALTVGVVMALIGGFAPLIIPNAYFPDAVRWVHMAEVVSSNFVFGLIAGWLLSPSPAAHTTTAVRSAA